MSVDPLLSQLAEDTAATPIDLTRLRARVRSAQAERPTTWARLVLPGAGLVLAAAAAATLAVWPTGASSPVSATLGEGPVASVEVAPGVTLTADGAGELSGTEQAPRLAWASGTVDVSVRPDAGLDVQVVTDEGIVRVVGTVFRVHRDALGTAVSVSRGEVEVECFSQAPTHITADEDALCLPTSAAGLLGRARALPRGSASVLEAVEAGLALEPDSAVGTELSALRVDHLAHGGAIDAAIAAAAEHLADPSRGRRDEVARIGATLAYKRDGCTSVGPFLSELPHKELAASALSTCEDQTGTKR